MFGYFMYASVACIVVPSVNTFFILYIYIYICTIFRIEIFLIWECEHIEGSTDFPLPNPIFAICLNFQQQNPLQNQYLSHLSSEIFEINFIKFDSLRAFQQHQECLQSLIHFSVLILFSFD